MDRIEEALGQVLVRWVRFVSNRARSVLALIGVTTAALFVYAGLTLGINSDNVSLIADHIDARRNYLEFARSFPNIENVMLVVIDGETPEIARDATESLREALSGRPDLFRDVYIPGSGPFFEKNGLLYRDLDDLDEFATQIARVQPILTALEREPTVANLASLIQSGLAQTEETDVALDDLAVLLDRVGDATVEVYQEFPLAISWEEILLRGSSVEMVKQWTLVVDPVLDFGSLFAAAAPMAEVRRIAEENGLDPDHGVTVRLTGNPVLNYEEMAGLLWDIGLGGVITFCFVVLVLFRALRAIRLVVASILTLLAGLVWTGAFAAASVGSLNLISLSFAILFIGLGVDFAIHLGMAYVDGLRRAIETVSNETSGKSADGSSDLHLSALEYALEQVGSSFVICTITTAIGFYVFIPTDNIGVAELGLIAGTGMVINLFLTTTLFPALMATACRLDPLRDVPRAMAFKSTWWAAIAAWPRSVALVALALLCFGAWNAINVQFDANVVRMRDPETESVQTFKEMLAEAGQRSPWPMDTVASDLESATRIAREVESLAVVDLAVTLADYIPEDQEEKLMVLEDIGLMLDAPRGGTVYTANPTTEEQIEALRALRDFLADPSINEEPGLLATSMRALRASLDEFLVKADRDEDVDGALARLETVLLGGLTDQLTRLRESTLIDEIGLEDLPEQLRNRMMTEDGRARVQIFPAEQLIEEAAFTRFASEVQAVVPGATGLPMNLIAFAQATRASFEEAMLYAAVLISSFLAILWRRPAPVVLVLAPLALSNLLTIGLMSVLGIAFNFVNVVVVPLLLGIGVDSGIHLVHRAEVLARTSRGGDLLSSTTARAVFYSALTTTVSFGTLALSSHRGVASLGLVLSLGMTLTVISNLVVLPALLALRPTSRAKPT
jgi:hopanoid biosynthesis associated RND transporter like protein HpnN